MKMNKVISIKNIVSKFHCKANLSKFRYKNLWLEDNNSKLAVFATLMENAIKQRKRHHARHGTDSAF